MKTAILRRLFNFSKPSVGTRPTMVALPNRPSPNHAALSELQSENFAGIRQN